MESTALYDLAIALGLGLLVGFERQRKDPDMAGVRTFALITVLGALAAILAREYGNALLVAAIAAVAGLVIMSNLIQLRHGEADPGITTEIAALLMFGVGVAAGTGYRLVAATVAGSVALLLHWKRPLHALAQHLDEAEVRAGMRLVLIGLVILPILPDRAYGPYDVLNPFQIWLMVVLIVGISLAGYAAYRVFGARSGSLLGGALGGLISSTAATVAYSRRAREAPSAVAAAAVMILVASAVVFVRILFEIAVVAPAQLAALGPPLVVMLVLLAALAGISYRAVKDGLIESGDRKPPSDLRAAIVFGLLYGAVLFAVAAAQDRFGTSGLYIVAGISGLTDMDAITLSTAQLVERGQLETSIGWRVILLAGMANLVFKAIAVAVLATPSLAKRVAGYFLVAIVVGIALILFVPG